MTIPVEPLRATRSDDALVLIRRDQPPLRVDGLPPRALDRLVRLHSVSSAALTAVASPSELPLLARLAEAAAPLRPSAPLTVRVCGPASWVAALEEVTASLRSSDSDAITSLDVPVTHTGLDVDGCDRAQQTGRLVLPVVLDGPGALVGPLLDGAGPCARCVERHRADRWPGRALLLSGIDVQDGEMTAADPAVRCAVAGVVGLLLRGIAHGSPPPDGLAVHVNATGPVVQYLRWPRHPGCGCDTLAV